MSKGKVPRSKTALEIAWDMFRLICMMEYVTYEYDRDMEVLILTYLDYSGKEMQMQCRVSRDEFEKVIHDLLLK